MEKQEPEMISLENKNKLKNIGQSRRHNKLIQCQKTNNDNKPIVIE